MADNIRTVPLRLRPSEHRALLFLGDLLMSIASVFAAIEVWRRYNFSAEIARLLARDIALERATQLAGATVLTVPLWFYVLPIIWLVLLVELYEPHIAASGRKTTRGVAIAAFVGLMAYSLVFILQQNSNLPRIGVGAFLFFASLLTLGWRLIFIRIYKSTGQRRRMLIIGAGKAGETIAELYHSLGPRALMLWVLLTMMKKKRAE
jgi:FlaA1/EpsC-like NDP-sugar epimerase